MERLTWNNDLKFEQAFNQELKYCQKVITDAELMPNERLVYLPQFKYQKNTQSRFSYYPQVPFKNVSQKLYNTLTNKTQVEELYIHTNASFENAVQRAKTGRESCQSQMQVRARAMSPSRMSGRKKNIVE
ncbi:Hypothetical_protein [Hexamita inflata]|uniref:Hypothetical_protein n=1 Tax=Hexamita inflata TaxID=28002 RepID=A0AA86N7E7_9EUKA|nr:Hypothetical protein HINF_LOCUS1855 [Hexamita inflata]CAI9947292.1 Hypothetical protein HINF_LOCUS34937 [Hexamita inflata]